MSPSLDGMQMANGSLMLRRVLLFAFVIFALAALRAETVSEARISAEQAVGLMVWGLEPRASEGLPAGPTWQVQSANGQRSVITVTRLSHCGFSAWVEKRINSASPPLVATYTFNFAAVHTYLAWPTDMAHQANSVLIKGSGWFDLDFLDRRNGRTLHVIRKGDVHTFATAENTVDRLHRAFLDFRRNHCDVHVHTSATLGEQR